MCNRYARRRKEIVGRNLGLLWAAATRLWCSLCPNISSERVSGKTRANPGHGKNSARDGPVCALRAQHLPSTSGSLLAPSAALLERPARTYRSRLSLRRGWDTLIATGPRTGVAAYVASQVQPSTTSLAGPVFANSDRQPRAVCGREAGPAASAKLISTSRTK